MARPSQKLHPTMVRLPERLRRELEQLAGFYSRSLNAEIVHRLERALAEDKAKRQQSGPKAPSVEDRLDKIEKTLESYASVLKAQQKVAQDALAALARESKKTEKGEGQ